MAARVDTQYDGFGRVWQVSNPVASSSQGTDWTVTTYDALGRVTAVTHPDSSQATTSYDVSAATANPTGQAALTTTIADESGKQRVQYVDGLGRLIGVVEDPGSGHANYSTIYAYDGLDNLRTVTQGGQTRTFTYDMLGRLLTGANPESGPVTYTYDGNGNLLTKTDARTTPAATVSMTYDPANRLTGKSYASSLGTPAVQFCYDGQTYAAGGCTGSPISAEAGFLTGVGNSTSSSAYMHQALGQVRWSSQTTGGTSYQFQNPGTQGDGYVYDAAGDLTDIWYPSGRHLTYAYDGAGRVSGVGGSYNGASTTYAGSALYWPHGALAQITLNNGHLIEQACYNNRLQPVVMRQRTQTPADCTAAPGPDANDVLHVALQYYSGNPTQNSGNMWQQTITSGAGAFQQNYTYDGVNRLQTATETGPGGGWSQSYGYDAVGNRWVTAGAGIGGNPGFVPTSQAAFNTANQTTINNAAYDSVGNQTQSGGYSYGYDAENRLTSSDLINATVYGYDGEGRRVMKVDCPGASACVSGTQGAATTWYVYDAMGQLAAEYGQGATPPCQTCYLMADHLGSTRMMTDAQLAGDGSVQVRALHDYLPFGEELLAGTDGRSGLWGGGDPKLKFTGKLRDDSSESGLDYFGARYYSGAQGRFTSPDLPVDQHPADPQSWNLYSYVRNNPLSMTDPSGDYACGTYVTAAQCTALGNMLTQAQTILDTGKAGGTIDSDQYKAATKALGAYGTLDDGNGVTVNVGATGGFPGSTLAEGGGEKTAANPTGQNIQVTFNGKLFDQSMSSAQGSTPALLGTIAHEGSHVEDAEAWAKAGFTAGANPTNFKTEFAAYGVTITMGQAQGAQSLAGTKPGGNTSMVFWNSHKSWGDNQSLRTNMIKALYPNWALKAFGENTKGSGK
jgi:RHS repeat-associated protein